MVKYNFREIHVVPSAENFIDVMLSKTNRQTPTIVRRKWKISHIRQFYMRKVRFTQQNIVERLSKIIEQFPKLDTIHPFYADLMNVLYDKDHYKLALGQINIARQLITNVGRDYVKLLKYGDSLYRCQHLKRAALGRMVKILKQQKSGLGYLEQVRQHLSRLPSIDPHTRTLLLCGFPNVGKSSFINKITRANVEVQNYPFTTKSLYIGHCDYKYLRWQIIDSPGVLDRPLEERNTIEMQAITALAHLNACIVYFLDLSPLCQYPIKQQCHLFKSISPLFNNKPVVLVANKTDLRKISELDANEVKYIDEISKMKNVQLMPMSNETEEGVMNVRNLACELLLSHRVEIKAQANKLQAIENRLFVAFPMKRDNKPRPPNIPQSVLKEWELKRQGIEIPKKPKKLAKDIENELGGPGVFSYDIREHWNLENDEWKYDPIPEIYNGKNISDFYSMDIDERLNELEQDESRILLDELENPHDSGPDLDEDEELLYRYIRRKQIIAKKEHRHSRIIRNNRSLLTRPDKKNNLDELKERLGDLGINTSRVSRRVQYEQTKVENKLEARGRTRSRGDEADALRLKEPQDGKDLQQIARAQSRARSTSTGLRKISTPEGNGAVVRTRSTSRSRLQPRIDKGTGSVAATKAARQLKFAAIKYLNSQGRVHESDRKVLNAKPKHLFSGKRGLHKQDWR